MITVLEQYNPLLTASEKSYSERQKKQSEFHEDCSEERTRCHVEQAKALKASEHSLSSNRDRRLLGNMRGSKCSRPLVRQRRYTLRKLYLR